MWVITCHASKAKSSLLMTLSHEMQRKHVTQRNREKEVATKIRAVIQPMVSQVWGSPRGGDTGQGTPEPSTEGSSLEDFQCTRCAWASNCGDQPPRGGKE